MLIIIVSRLHEVGLRLNVDKTDKNYRFMRLSAVARSLNSGIDVGQGINVGPGKFGKKNRRRALNTLVLCSK